ncbi:MAG: type IV toxin-antitoxin system AbiEi family antitoxin domain-containing protein [Nitrososphaerota archaeon]|nr:type IV toxin-antitoxin system AbiEi family antitoxin domain-containing protein [Nitrososphaerota archaeon]MDG7040769.1 type IV toxin-antitoxin system AbiEi family antitoxin domain-containing protein [Nitrososphaerota archaeon]MDG7047824.1 type IV toxin-antitoxin system AbiEi family antitoxin domain-containing protein [Nitrososphaerota archaeon]
MCGDLAPETVLLILIQRDGLLFRRADFVQLGYSDKQYYTACQKLLAAGLIKRLGKGQYAVVGCPALLAPQKSGGTPD